MIIIVKRHKDSNGVTKGYTIRSDNEEVYLDKNVVIPLFPQIYNAVLLSNGEFEAKSGCFIETVVDNSSLVASESKEHNYIDVKRLWDFSKKKTFDDIYDDLEKNYKITNLCEGNDNYEESLVCLTDALESDYRMERANYEAYIEVGINARTMMELRKSAVLLLEEDLYDFYTGHRNCETAQDVKSYRTDYLRFLNSDYMDLNWQYYSLVKYNLRGKSRDFYFDYESCFGDGDYRKQTTIEDYKREFIEAHRIILHP